MRKLLLTHTLLLFIAFLVSAQTIREMKFEEVSLDVIVKSIAKLADKNVIIDPSVKDLLSTQTSIFIQKPMDINKAFNIILREYGLIAVPVNDDIYKITRAGEIELNINGLSSEDIDKLVKVLKDRVSPSAEIVIDNSLKTMYIRDESERLKKMEKSIRSYIDSILKKKTAGEEEKRKAFITRVFYLKTLSIDEAKQILLPHTTAKTVITEAPSFNALVITDKRDRIEKYTELLRDFLVSSPMVRKPITKIFYLRYISPEEFIKMIEPIRSEAGLILSGGALKVDKRENDQGKQQQKITPILREFNAVMITDYPEVIEKIREKFSDYISDVPPQVKIEARILEVRKEVLREIGIDWNFLLSNVRLPQSWSGGGGVNSGVGVPGAIEPGLTDTAGGILTFTYTRGILNALNLRLSAFERLGKVKSLAKPTVITINGQKAVIKQGQEIPYQTAVVAGGGNVANIQFKEAVLELSVLPIISPDGRIMLDISLKQDTPGTLTPVGPAINTKKVSTKVIVNSGDTVVIGGIIDSFKNSTMEGVAGLVRVPLLKWLFGQEKFQDQDIELLIFITPTIIEE